MNNVYISVISHKHSEIIKKIDCLNSLSKKFHVVLKSNITDNIEDYCRDGNIFYMPPDKVRGFGENNNFVFNYCKENLGMNKDDYFVVLNPDVDITHQSISDLILKMKSEDVVFSTINLYRDKAMTEHDFSIRKFPELIDFIRSYIGLHNMTIIDKKIIKSPSRIDWAAGSFLAFKAGVYESICGFDKKYFMYCEDIDICYRLNKIKNIILTYYPDVVAIHYAQFKNRRILSKHFFWHVRSVLIFLINSKTMRSQQEGNKSLK